MVEETNTEKDSRTGLERIELKRKIGEKERILEQKRVAGGAIETKEQLHGVEDGLPLLHFNITSFHLLQQAKNLIVISVKQPIPLVFSLFFFIPSHI